MAAAIREHGGATGAVAKQHDRFIADPTRKRLPADLVRPRRDIPGITQQHLRPPRCQVWTIPEIRCAGEILDRIGPLYLCAFPLRTAWMARHSFSEVAGAST